MVIQEDYFIDGETDGEPLDENENGGGGGGGTYNPPPPPHVDHADHSDIVPHSDHADTPTVHFDIPHIDDPYWDQPIFHGDDPFVPVDHTDHSDAPHNDHADMPPPPPVHTDQVINPPPIPHTDNVPVPPPPPPPPPVQNLDIQFDPPLGGSPDPFNTTYRSGEAGTRRKSYRVYNNEDLMVSIRFEGIPSGVTVEPNPIIVNPQDNRVFTVELSNAFLRGLSVGRTTKTVGMKLSTETLPPAPHTDTPLVPHGDHTDAGTNNHNDHSDIAHSDATTPGQHGDATEVKHTDHTDAPIIPPSQPLFDLVVDPRSAGLVFDPQTKTSELVVRARMDEVIDGVKSGNIAKNTNIVATLSSNLVKMTRTANEDGTADFKIVPNYDVNPLDYSNMSVILTVKDMSTLPMVPPQTSTQRERRVTVDVTLPTNARVDVGSPKWEEVGPTADHTFTPDVYEMVPGTSYEQKITNASDIERMTARIVNGGHNGAQATLRNNRTGEVIVAEDPDQMDSLDIGLGDSLTFTSRVAVPGTLAEVRINATLANGIRATGDAFTFQHEFTTPHVDAPTHNDIPHSDGGGGGGPGDIEPPPEDGETGDDARELRAE